MCVCVCMYGGGGVYAGVYTCLCGSGLRGRRAALGEIEQSPSNPFAYYYFLCLSLLFVFQRVVYRGFSTRGHH